MYWLQQLQRARREYSTSRGLNNRHTNQVGWLFSTYDVITKALRKAEYSDLRIFMKFGTRFCLYSVFRIFRIFRIASKLYFGKHKTYDKTNKTNENELFQTKNPIFRIYEIYFVKIEFIFSRKTHFNVNFNQKFESNYGTQGLSYYTVRRKSQLPFNSFIIHVERI